MIKIDNRLSQNSSLIKIVSLLLIIIGHYFKNFPWIFSSVAIIIFSFLSGYFIFIKYSEDFNWRLYWRKKIIRLGIDLLIVNIFLIILFIVEEKNGILTWQTIMGVTGLTGILYWFYIPDPSPFHVEIWFFTLLLIFYILFPIIRLAYRKKVTTIIFSLLILFTAAYLDSKIKYNFAFWLAICGFLISCTFARLEIKLKLLNSSIALVICIITYLILNRMHIYFFNFYTYFICALCLLFIFISISWPNFFYKGFKMLSESQLEIYLIHRHLFLHITGYTYFDFGLSLALIFIVAIGLKKIAIISKKRLLGI